MNTEKNNSNDTGTIKNQNFTKNGNSGHTSQSVSDIDKKTAEAIKNNKENR